jgi:hypothetical protein
VRLETVRRRIASDALLRTRQFLTAPRTSPALVAALAKELVQIAADHHGKDPTDRLAQLRVVEATAPDEGPHFTVVDDEALIVLSQGTLTGDYRRQAVYQLAHAATYAAVSETGRHTWVDEMLAMRFAVHVMEQVDPRYAAQTIADIEAAAALPVSELLEVDLDAEPESPAEGFYERAWLVGRDLERALGWPTVRRLARPLEPRQLADVDTWLAELDDDQRAAAHSILPPASSARRPWRALARLGKRFARPSAARN